jgi:hypothetical protein
MMSPKWPQHGLPLDPEAYDKAGVSKYAIIMTDGEFNTFETNGQLLLLGIRYELVEDLRAENLCDAMKNNGVKIYSIAFAAGAEAKSLMQSCAPEQRRRNSTSTPQTRRVSMMRSGRSPKTSRACA